MAEEHKFRMIEGVKPYVKQVKKHTDKNRGGCLSAIEPMELFKEFPKLKAFYFIINEPLISKPRGGHYHNIKQEAMFAVKGNVAIRLIKGEASYYFELKNNSEQDCVDIVYVPPGWWHEVEFLTSDAILGVLSSTTYDEVIRNSDDIREAPK